MNSAIMHAEQIVVIRLFQEKVNGVIVSAHRLLNVKGSIKSTENAGIFGSQTSI